MSNPEPLDPGLEQADLKPQPLRVLIVEDRADDAELVIRQLRRDGYDPQWRRVETEAEFLEALTSELDLVVSDFRLPRFDGPRALHLLQRTRPTVPFILVSGTIGEDIAVESMKAGAADYLLKDRLIRLGPAVRHALDQCRLRNERQGMSEAVLRAEARYRGIFENAVEGLFRTTIEGRLVEANPALAKIYGFDSAADLLAAPVGFWDRCLDADRGVELQRRLQEEGGLASFEAEMRRGDGRVIWTATSARKVQDEQGSSCYEGSIEDVTERRHAVEALRESESRYQALVRTSMDGFYVMDSGGRLLEVSDRCCDILGYPREMLIGMWMTDLAMPEESESQRKFAESVLSEGWGRLESRYRRNDGQPIDVEVSTVLLPRRGLMLNFVRDITRRKQAEDALRRSEEQLRQAQKMEAVGRLAGGVAHDFNNLLTVISGNAEFLLEGIAEADPLRNDAREILAAGERAASLTRQLLAFSRKQVLQPQVINLNQIVLGVQKMLRRLIGEDIELSTKLAQDLANVRADPGQIEQVILNLAVNSRDAMPSGGKLTIETENVELDSDAEDRPELTRRRFVRLSITDTGCGMDEQTLSQIFEPFFTTKEAGRGTGLGLSTVYGIVKQSGGQIGVCSALNCGTTLRIDLPRELESVHGATPPAPHDDRAHGSGETILLVEDEEFVRNLIEQVLRTAGYTMLVAANGEQALRLCAGYLGPIHLVLTDMIMPQMSGREMVERLKHERRDVRVLYCSGYADNAVLQQSLQEPGAHHLAKPFSIMGLKRKVRDALDAEVPPIP